MRLTGTLALHLKLRGLYGDVCECGNMCAQPVPPASDRVPNMGMKEMGDKSDSILEGSTCWQKAETIIKSWG